VPVDEHQALADWLAGDNLIDGFDDLDLDLMAPAEIMARSCVSCHSDGSGVAGAEETPLNYWEDVARLVSNKEIRPVPRDILITSLHTHAISIGLLVILVGLLAAATRFHSIVRAIPMLLGGAGALADLSGQVLAREHALAVGLILGGGAALGI